MKSRKVRVGVVGVGNCASSFIQGLTYYRDAAVERADPRSDECDLGGYHVSDIEIACAFDVNAEKVGRGRRQKRSMRTPNNT